LRNGADLSAHERHRFKAGATTPGKKRSGRSLAAGQASGVIQDAIVQEQSERISPRELVK
jgi:hypothetical protein